MKTTEKKGRKNAISKKIRQNQQNITIRTTTTIGLLLVSAVLRVPHR